MASRSAALSYQSALERTVRELEERMVEEQRKDAERRAALVIAEAKAHKVAAEHRQARHLYADELRSQMAIDLQKKREIRKELQRSGIDPTFSGFPNIPETPGPVKLQRKKVQQQEMKALLEQQIKEKEEREQLKKLQTKTSDQELIERARAVLEQELQFRARKASQQREEMVRSWQEAKYTQLLKRSLDGRLHTMVPVLPSAMSVETSEDEGDEEPAKDETKEPQEEADASEMEVEQTSPKPQSPGPEATTPKAEKSMHSDSQPVPLRVQPPTVQQYSAYDIRDVSLCRTRNRNATIGFASVAPLTRSQSNAKGWTFVTTDPPHSNRRSFIRGAGLRVLNSHAVLSPPVIATTKTRYVQKSALPHYGMILTKPRTLNNV